MTNFPHPLLMFALCACTATPVKGENSDRGFVPISGDSGEAGETGAPTDSADSADTAEAGVTDDTSATDGVLSINELMADNVSSYLPDGESSPDWIELYNPGASAVDLLGWSISDDPDLPETHVFEASLEVPAGGFLVLLADGDFGAGATHLSFKLGSDGDEIVLFTPAGRRVDWVRFEASLPDISAARRVDGSESDGWVYVSLGTPGVSNTAR